MSKRSSNVPGGGTPKRSGNSSGGTATPCTHWRGARHETAQLEESIEDPESGPEHAGVLVGVRADLRGALEQLTPGQRAVLVLRDVYGWTHAEVSRELGITQTTAKVRLHRARKRLRELLEGSM